MKTFKQFISEKIQVNQTARDLHKHVTSHGWTLTRQKGSHDVYTHPKSTKTLAIPRHKGDIAPGTVRQIVNNSTTFDK